MRLEWDDDKRQRTLKERKLDFADAAIVFAGMTVASEDTDGDYPERRWMSIGLLGNKLVVIVHTDLDEKVVRVISMRRVTKHERKLYEKEMDRS